MAISRAAIAGAMDTAGRAVLFAGATVIIALLGQFALGVDFLYGLAIASSLAVLMTMLAALTVLPALLSRFGERIGRRRSGRVSPRAPRRLPHERLRRLPAATPTRLLGAVVGLHRAPPVAGNDRGPGDHAHALRACARAATG